MTHDCESLELACQLGEPSAHQQFINETAAKATRLLSSNISDVTKTCSQGFSPHGPGSTSVKLHGEKAKNKIGKMYLIYILFKSGK